MSYLVILLSISWTTLKLETQKTNTSLKVDEVIKKVTQNPDLMRTRHNDFLIDTNIVYSSAAMQQSNPAISFDGTNYFVVWEDFRMVGAYHGDIFGARISQSGSILDPTSIFISEDGRAPAVAFDGINYLVVWSDDDIYGVRIDPSGQLIDTSRIVIAADSIPKDQPAVSFDGTNFLVIWSTYSELFCARVSQGGIVLDTIPIHIPSAGDYIRRPSVAYGDTCYLVVWSQYWGELLWNIYGTRVNRDGVVPDTVPIWFDWAMNTVDPDVAFDGTNYLVVWESWWDIKGMRVNQAGVLIDSSAIVVMEGQVPSVAFDGTNYLVVCDVQDIYGVRVDTSGAVVDTQAIAISTASGFQRYPVVAFGGTNYLVAWQDERNGSNFRDIYGTRVTQVVGVLDSVGIEISGAVNAQHFPAVAFGVSNYLTVWQDNRDKSWNVHGLRLDPSGMVLDTGIVISDAWHWQQTPSVVFGDSDFFVVWEDYRNNDSIWPGTDQSDVYGARVNQYGAVLDSTGIAIAIGPWHQKSPDVAFDGTNYLVVWEDSNSFYPDIYGAMINQSGNILDEIAISTAAREQLSPSVAYDGTNYFVVWRDARSGYDWNIYGARVDVSGVVLDTGIPITLASNWQYKPEITFGGNDYFAVWEDERNGMNNRDIFGARVDVSGTVLDPEGIEISAAPGEQRFPVVDFDGTDYVVLWQDSRSGYDWDIYGARISASGTLINVYEVTILTDPQLAPALATSGNDTILVTYSGWTDSINTHAAYTTRIWGKFNPFVGVTEEASSERQIVKYALHVNPNLVSGPCYIRFTLPRETNVRLSLYDVTGRLVQNMTEEKLEAGTHKESVDVSCLAQGVYFVRLDTSDHSIVEKIIFVK